MLMIGILIESCMRNAIEKLLQSQDDSAAVFMKGVLDGKSKENHRLFLPVLRL